MFIIKKIKPLSECSHEPINKYTDLSEWALSYALMKFGVGAQVSEEQLHEAALEARTQELLMQAEKENLIASSLNEDGVICYNITEAGKDYLGNE